MELAPNSAIAYRNAHHRKLMVLTKWKSADPASDEFCRIRSVETLSPGLWVTAAFLDGSIRQFRPEKIREATADEERRSGELLAAFTPEALPA